jgi:hypothetical protein
MSELASESSTQRELASESSTQRDLANESPTQGEPSPPTALWVPFEVDDLDAATRHYVENIGLSVVDSWIRDGERGVVLRVADGAFVELVSPATGHPQPSLAFEQASESKVDGRFAAWHGEASRPSRYPRGHYGFTAPGPAGATVMIWSER